MSRNADHMRLQFLLLQRMEERGVRFSQLSKLTGIAGERLRAIAYNKVKRVTPDEIARIIGALGISANDLFDCYEADVFTGARIEKEITLHLVIKSDAGNGAEGGLKGGGGAATLAAARGTGRSRRARLGIETTAGEPARIRRRCQRARRVHP